VVAPSLAVQTQAVDMKSSKDLESAFEAANKGHARALIVLLNPLTLAARTQIGDMAVKRRLPTMYLYSAHVDAGGSSPTGRTCRICFGVAASMWVESWAVPSQASCRWSDL
jgi:hypothetical protein